MSRGSTGWRTWTQTGQIPGWVGWLPGGTVGQVLKPSMPAYLPACLIAQAHGTLGAYTPALAPLHSLAIMHGMPSVWPACLPACPVLQELRTPVKDRVVSEKLSPIHGVVMGATSRSYLMRDNQVGRRQAPEWGQKGAGPRRVADRYLLRGVMLGRQWLCMLC